MLYNIMWELVTATDSRFGLNWVEGGHCFVSIFLNKSGTSSSCFTLGSHAVHVDCNDVAALT